MAATVARRRVVDFLHHHDGSFADAGGLTLRRLADELGYKSVGGLSHLLAGMEAEGLIGREIRGRRTYCVRLESVGEPQARRCLGQEQ